MINKVAEKFQEAWSKMDISSLSECISDKVTYSAIPSGNNLTGKTEVISLLASKFRLFKEYQAITTLEKPIGPHSEFAISLRYEGFKPVTTYMVNYEGVFMVICLEPGLVTMEITIQVKCKSNKISDIKLFQKRIIECRKTA
jgi:hypothetical protein